MLLSSSSVVLLLLIYNLNTIYSVFIYLISYLLFTATADPTFIPFLALKIFVTMLSVRGRANFNLFSEFERCRIIRLQVAGIVSGKMQLNAPTIPLMTERCRSTGAVRKTLTVKITS